MREDLNLLFIVTVLGIIPEARMRRGAIDALRKATHVLFARKTVLRHMIRGDEETVGGDQESRSQIVPFPVAFAILMLDQDLQASRPHFRPSKLSPFGRKLFSFGEIVT